MTDFLYSNEFVYELGIPFYNMLQTAYILGNVIICISRYITTLA